MTPDPLAAWEERVMDVIAHLLTLSPLILALPGVAFGASSPGLRARAADTAEGGHNRG